MIDTNILIDFLNGVDEAREELNRYNFPIISIITWMEVMVGAKDEAEQQLLHPFFERYRIDEIDSITSWEAVKIRQRSRKKLPDAIIEATAIANETLLVTRNDRDFDASLPHIRIPYRL